jgi:hypothetical protein
LTPDLFGAAVAAGDVLAIDTPDRWAALILDRPVDARQDDACAALLCGDGAAAVELLRSLGGAAGPLRQLRLPDGAPILAGHEPAFLALGYVPHEGRTLFLEGPLDRRP